MAILGGMLWVVAWTYYASQWVLPPGGIRPMGGETHEILGLVSILLVMAGLTSAFLQQAETKGTIGKVGIALSWIGAGLMGAWVLDVVSPWLFFMGGFLVVIAGVGILVLAMLLAKVIPRTVVVALIVGLVLMILVNSEDRRAFLAVPFGLSWVWLGYVLWGRARGESGVIRSETDAGRSGPGASF